MGDLPAANPPSTIGNQTDHDLRVVMRLEGYRQESENNRKTGMNNRDDKWLENLNLYWNRWDWTTKASWQSKETMPEVPGFVDRFAGAMKDALLAGGGPFYDVVDPGDKEQDLATAVRGMLDVWLSRVGMDATGRPLDFPCVFEDQVKLGALMMMASTVTWKNDVPEGRVAVESHDPRNIFLDNQGRNLYRARRYYVDRYQLEAMAKQMDKSGKPIWKLPGVAQLLSNLMQVQQVGNNVNSVPAPELEEQQLQGTSHDVSTTRTPICLDEYYATILDNDGKETHEKSLCVVANQKYLIRGPEENPFWHKQDWLVATPLVTSPLSVYGRTYMEDFGAVAKTFNDLTNLILDAVFFSSIRAFAAVPTALLNPSQLSEGIWPGKTFLLEDGMNPEQFAKALELGALPNESIMMWKALKAELTEAAGINEVGLGQFAPKGRTTAHEVAQASQSSSAIIKSVAQTIEKRWLDPTLNLVWKVGLQHCKRNDKTLMGAAGEDMYYALWQNRRELITRPIAFQARGISRMVQKQTALRSLMQVLQIIGSNEMLLQAFMQEVDIQKLLKLVFQLNDVDLSKLTMSERDKMMRQMAQPLQQAQQQAGGPQPQPQGAPGRNTPGQIEMSNFAKRLGISNAQSAMKLGAM